jgi:hypothetical protein
VVKPSLFFPNSDILSRPQLAAPHNFDIYRSYKHLSSYLYAPTSLSDPSRNDHHPIIRSFQKRRPTTRSVVSRLMSQLPPSFTPGGRHYEPIPGQPPIATVHTSDSNTKLTVSMRRRCFNCCTVDTSAWRRSNLFRGEIVCFFYVYLFNFLFFYTAL